MTYMLCKHYGLRTGVNFEILAGIDLTKKSDVDFLMNYMTNKPRVVLMGPPCIGYCKWGNLNKRINYAAWLRGRKLSVPMAKLCGDVALSFLKTDISCWSNLMAVVCLRSRSGSSCASFPSKWFLINAWLGSR